MLRRDWYARHIALRWSAGFWTYHILLTFHSAGVRKNAAARPTRDVGGASCSAGIARRIAGIRTPYCTPLECGFLGASISIDMSLRWSEEERAAYGWWAVPTLQLYAPYWRLVTGHWSLATGHWSLVGSAHWSLATDHWSLATDHCFSVFLKPGDWGVRFWCL